MLGNGTLDLIVPALVGSALRHGVALQCVTVPYGLYPREILDPQSAINRAGCDAVLLALDARALPLQAADASPAPALDMIDSFRDNLRRHGGTTCIVQTLASFPEALFGSADRRIAGAPRHLVDAFNRDLVDLLEGSPDILFDVAGLAETVGLARWHCPAQWNVAKLPFADACVPLYADHVGRLLGAMRGKSRRCLVLDLDNTVWGGVIGDDGLDGIGIGRGPCRRRSVPRRAAAAPTCAAAASCSRCRRRTTTRWRAAPFATIPRCSCARTTSRCSRPTGTTRRATSRRSPRSCRSAWTRWSCSTTTRPSASIVRQLLPRGRGARAARRSGATTRARWPRRAISRAIVFSEEDRRRAELYQRNAERVALQQSAGDLAAFHASLDMEIHFAPFDAVGRTRIVAADQQVQPVQPDDAPLHRGGGGGDGG